MNPRRIDSIAAGVCGVLALRCAWPLLGDPMPDPRWALAAAVALVGAVVALKS